jgi:predicted amidohydrolase
MFIVGSTLSALGGEKYGNTLTVFSPQGRMLAEYSKIHLFRLMQEEKYLTAGNQPVCVDLPFGRAGLAICYDLRFPELFRGYALAGADLVFLPSEWPRPRLSHWQTLVRARAIENQIFMVAVNRVGRDTANEFFGHSLVVDPWGEILTEGGEGEELITVEIDPLKVQEARRKIPILQDRRPDVYK